MHTDCEKCGQKLPTPKFDVGDCVRGKYDRALYLWLEVNMTPEGYTLVYPAKVVEAIKKCWREWDRQARDMGYIRKECSLCVLFRPTGGCRECPIGKKTGGSACEGSPYQAYVNNPTSANAYAFRDWIGELLPESVVAELKEESFPEERTPKNPTPTCPTCNQPIKETYRVGDLFECTRKCLLEGEIFKVINVMLVGVRDDSMHSHYDKYCGAINIKTFDFFYQPVVVKDPYKITHEDMCRLMSKDYKKLQPPKGN